jgi:hypothetical protein
MIELIKSWKDRNKFYSFALAILFVYISFLTFISSFWRIDAHHDGYVYLSASQALSGKLPPDVTNHHGIASPYIESLILNLTSNSLINYRFIGLTVIFITAMYIFRIINLKLNALTALVFTLLWLSANPSWVGSIKQTPTGIQSIWPNLWVQLFTLMGFFIILKYQKLSVREQTILGIIFATLPFIRIQACISLIVLITLTYIRFRKINIIILAASAITTFFWLNLIRLNGGIALYLRNILGDPLSKKDYAEFITLDAILYNVANKIKYYIVISVLAAVIFFAIVLWQRNRKLDSNLTRQKIVFFTLTTSLILLTIKNPFIWISTLYVHATTLLIDLSVPLSVIYICYILKQYVFKSVKVSDGNHILPLSLSILNLMNLVNQFPLSDRGHKWWSSAPSVIFLAYLINNESFEKNLALKKYNVKKIVYSFLVISVCFSSLEGSFFQKIARNKISGYQFANFNGINYPEEDKESVQNLLLSIEVLTHLEEMNVSIFYKCEDGLYYFRQNKLSVDARSALAKNIDIPSSRANSVIFVCNSTRDRSFDFGNYNVFTIGRNFPDLFLVDKNSTLNAIVKDLIN